MRENFRLILLNDADAKNKLNKYMSLVLVGNINGIEATYEDIKEEITANIQYKLLTKMLNDRIKAAEIYNKANRTDLVEQNKKEIELLKIAGNPLNLKLFTTDIFFFYLHHF